MLIGYTGVAVTLRLVLGDRTVDKYPRARVCDSSGVIVGSAINMTAVGSFSGLYTCTFTPAAAGQFTVMFDVYSDSGHTTLVYEPAIEPLRVYDLDLDTVLGRLLGHAGENVRDDVLTTDPVTGQPLTFRRRLFATKAAANASTPGGTGEGEIATFTCSATYSDAIHWDTFLRVKEP